MSALAFLDGVARLPPPYDAERAARGRDDLARSAATAGGEAGEVIMALLAAPEGRALIDAVFGNSPFLGRTLLRDAAQLPALLTRPPEAAFAALLDEARAAGAEAPDAMVVLRRVRRRVALTVALADIAGLWPLDRVCRALSDFADAALTAAIERLLRAAARKGDLEVDPERPEPGSGLVVLAMGKHGAHELNYSSDIDIIIFFDRDCPYRGKETAQAFYVRLTQGLVRLLQHVTPEGYVFRTDLRLRPDPSATPAAVSLQAAEQYYESLGQNWERAAMIKARAAAGDIPLGEAFLAGLEPFVWRRNLDFAAIEDVHSIKRQIHEHRGLGSIAVEGHNIKLGRGGIRDIEFFVQTQQLIAGGRDPGLRQRGTAGAMTALAGAGWIAPAVGEEMMAAYRFHRTLEHRLQMVADEQTHSLPKTAAGIDHIARFAGYAETDAFRAELLHRLTSVQRHYAQLFEAEPGLGEGGNLVFTGTDDDPDTLETLAALGFSQPKGVSSTVRGWHHGRYRAMRSARARELLTDLTPVLLKALAETPSPDAAFGRFDRFLEGLPAGVQLFSMLKAQPALLRLLAEIVGSAPRLANYLSQNADVLDAVLEADFYQPLPPAAELVRSFQGGFRVARNMEDVLDTARRVVKERKFQLGVQLLTGAADGVGAGPAYAALADAVLTALTPLVLEDFARRHGRVPGAELAVIGMGKLGSQEMSAESDLDLLFVYDLPEGAGDSDGERPLSPGHYFARFSQRLVNALTAPTAEGRLYDVDMRLRPSGNAGPVAVGVEGFLDYQRQRAWTWEHMALTRVRVISAPEPLRARIEAGIDEVLRRPRDTAAVARDVVEMRRRIFAEKGSQDPWDLKQVRGGLIDIEFICQFLQLAHLSEHPGIRESHTGRGLEKIAAAGLLPAETTARLIEAWRIIHRLTALLRIAVAGARLDPDAAPEGLKRSLAKAAGVDRFEALEAHLTAIEAAVRAAFSAIVEAAAG
jgi:[glutamine synthetase] adenylyltransferase / [glutamine synthetase]-adenylyl-L-tyrosine phosphorylase